jgi:hypothetical protein
MSADRNVRATSWIAAVAAVAVVLLTAMSRSRTDSALTTGPRAKGTTATAVERASLQSDVGASAPKDGFETQDRLPRMFPWLSLGCAVVLTLVGLGVLAVPAWPAASPASAVTPITVSLDGDYTSAQVAYLSGVPWVSQGSGVTYTDELRVNVVGAAELVEVTVTLGPEARPFLKNFKRGVTFAPDGTATLTRALSTAVEGQHNLAVFDIEPQFSRAREFGQIRVQIPAIDVEATRVGCPRYAIFADQSASWEAPVGDLNNTPVNSTWFSFTTSEEKRLDALPCLARTVVGQSENAAAFTTMERVIPIEGERITGGRLNTIGGILLGAGLGFLAAVFGYFDVRRRSDRPTRI